MENVPSSPSLNVMLLAPMKNDSGNLTTTTRMQLHVQQMGHRCVAVDVAHIRDANQLTACLCHNQVQFIVALHAYRSGMLLAGCPLASHIGYVIILGGTDIHVDAHSTSKFPVINKCLQHSRGIVSFSTSMKEAALHVCPSIKNDQISIIPQAVEVKPSHFSLVPYLKQHHLLPQNSGAVYKIVLLVAGIRPVKDPLFLTHAFSEWHSSHNRSVYLVILGPEVDVEYTAKFRDSIKGLPGVLYIPGLPRYDTHAAITQSEALVNSSLSEGMSAAILEALALDCPVLARGIHGNRDLLGGTRAAMLYDTPQEFISCLERLLQSKSLREELTREGRYLLSTRHSLAAEQRAYHQLLNSLLCEKG